MSLNLHIIFSESKLGLKSWSFINLFTKPLNVYYAAPENLKSDEG